MSKKPVKKKEVKSREFQLPRVTNSLENLQKMLLKNISSLENLQNTSVIHGGRFIALEPYIWEWDEPVSIHKELDNVAKILCGPNICASAYVHKRIIYTANNKKECDIYTRKCYKLLKAQDHEGLLDLVAADGMKLYITEKFREATAKAKDQEKLEQIYYDHFYDRDEEEYEKLVNVITAEKVTTDHIKTAHSFIKLCKLSDIKNGEIPLYLKLIAEPLVDIIKAINYIIRQNIDDLQFIKNPEELHAEMVVLQFIVYKIIDANQRNESFDNTIYIGISKLSCAMCDLTINPLKGYGSFLNYADNHSLTDGLNNGYSLLTLGTHGKIYNGWKVPNFLHESWLQNLINQTTRPNIGLPIHEKDIPPDKALPPYSGYTVKDENFFLFLQSLKQAFTKFFPKVFCLIAEYVEEDSIFSSSSGSEDEKENKNKDYSGDVSYSSPCSSPSSGSSSSSSSSSISSSNSGSSGSSSSSISSEEVDSEIDKPDEVGYTKLMSAVEDHDDSGVRSLLQRRASPFIPDEFGNSAFSIALEETNAELAKLFLEKTTVPKELYKDISDDGALYYLVASNIFKWQELGLLESGFTETAAQICFADAIKACEIVGEDASDLFEID